MRPAHGEHLNLPPDLGTLMSAENLPAAFFVCPGSGTSAPSGLPDAQAKSWVLEHSDYEYAGADMETQLIGPNIVLAFEKPGTHHPSGINVLFGDGHVEWLSVPEALVEIRRSHGAYVAALQAASRPTTNPD